MSSENPDLNLFNFFYLLLIFEVKFIQHGLEIIVFKV